MKVKIFSVHADQDFHAIRVGEQTCRLSANDYLEDQIQHFLDEHPQLQLRQVQFSSVPIVPKTTSWDTTNVDIPWEIEKSVLVFFDGKEGESALDL